jgi:cytochrome P450
VRGSGSGTSSCRPGQRRRWLDPSAGIDVGKDRSQDRNDYACYLCLLSFGGGPQICIGDRFSLTEQTLVFAMAAQRFRVLIDDEVVPDRVFTLRPAGGIQARLEKLSDSSASLHI